MSEKSERALWDDLKDSARKPFETWKKKKMTSAKQAFANLQQVHRDADKAHRKTDLLTDLEKYASAKGFAISNNPGQGNCMFFALSEQMLLQKGIIISHEELRKDLVQFLKDHPKLPDGSDLFNFVMEYPTWTDYLEKMAEDGTWGDHVILIAAATHLNCVVRVISSLPDYDDIYIRPDLPVCDAAQPAELVLGHNYENHYVSLIPVLDRETLYHLYVMEQVKEGVKKGKEILVDIAKKASNKGFIVSDNVASGNCLFQALSEQLDLVKGIRVPHEELRKILVHFLKEHPNLRDGTELFNFVSGHPSWADYLTSMGKDGTWGNHVILYAAANCYETKIRVISLLSDHLDVIINPSYHVGSTKPLVLGHIQEVHYVSLPAIIVPVEILAKDDPVALEAYNEALAEGSTRVMRLPIMVIGQYRSGKTSLVKSLKGEMFNKSELPTDGIKKNVSIVSNEFWNTGEKNGESKSDAVSWCHERVAQEVASLIRQKENQESNQISPRSREPESSVQSKDLEPNIIAEDGTDLKQQIKNNIPISEDKDKEDVFELKVPNETEKRMIKKYRENPEGKDTEKIYSVVWDFAGQAVYYATHPIFFTPRAIYLLVHNLQLNPHAKASPVKHEGLFNETEDKYCSKTNADYLDVWMSSVSCLAKESSATENEPDMKLPDELEGKLPKKLPPVFLVCTHADEPYVSKDQARERSHAELPYDQLRAVSWNSALAIYGSLKIHSLYGKHLFKRVFAVDNSAKSTRGEECSEVDLLRKAILAVAQQLPHVKQDIPIKWLTFETALQSRKKEGNHCISLDEAKQIARVCKIGEDKHNHVLNFLHDQRAVIHFDDSEELKKLVILDVDWLIDMFKRVITVKRYEPEFENQLSLWMKLQTKGILEEELLHSVWDDLREDESLESLIAIMEKFGLLLRCPLSGSGEEYLVPSMLMSHPEEEVTKLLKAAHIPSLFLRFKQLSSEVYVPVPLGLFSRLVLKFLQWCTREKQSKPLERTFHKDFARFHVRPEEGYSVILLQRFFVIEVVVLKQVKEQTPQERSQIRFTPSDLQFCDSVQRIVKDMLTSMQKDFCWMRNVDCKLAILCPVCCEGGSFKGCAYHRNCNKEECLHFWSEKEFRECNQPICEKNDFAGAIVPVEIFKPWFGVSDKQEQQGVGESVLSFKDSLLADIVRNVHVMDELARRLDQPLCHGGRQVPIIQYWLHLAEYEEFKVSEDVRIKCQHNIESSPTKYMFEFQAARDPNFSVSDLKDGLRGISRMDLVKRLEHCNLPDAATLRDLRREHHETFESICLQLDHYKNWKPLGLNFSITEEMLQQIGTSSSCTETVLESIEKIKPNLTVKEMRDVLSAEMLRKDVCEVLDRYPEVKDENSTIATLRGNLNCLEEVATLLDKETPGMKNWLHLGWKFGISRNVLDNLKPRGNPSPTKALLEHITQKDPDLTVMSFIQTLIKMKRLDVVKALKEFFCDGKDIDSMITPMTV